MGQHCSVKHPWTGKNRELWNASFFFLIVLWIKNGWRKRMKKALYRKRICAEKEKLTPEKVFHTPQYRDLLTSIGHEITGGKLTTLRLYDDKIQGLQDGIREKQLP